MNPYTAEDMDDPNFHVCDKYGAYAHGVTVMVTYIADPDMGDDDEVIVIEEPDELSVEQLIAEEGDEVDGSSV